MSQKPEIKYYAFKSKFNSDWQFIYRVKNGNIEDWSNTEKAWKPMGTFEELSEEQFTLWKIKRDE